MCTACSSRRRATCARRSTDQREHAAMPLDEVEAVAVAPRAQAGREHLAQAQHVGAHLVELGPPLGAQGRVVQDRADDRGTVRRRRRVVRARDAEQLSQHDVRPLRRGAEHEGAADPVAIEPEILRAGGRDDHLRHPRREPAHARGILLQAVAETLVGEVDERQEAARRAPDPRSRPNARAAARRRSGCGSSRAAAPRRPARPGPAPRASRPPGPRWSRGRNRGSFASPARPPA